MTTQELFSLTTRPDKTLFYSRNDSSDVRLGDVVLHEMMDYDSSEIVLLGCPQDEGVRRNGGRVGAAKAPAAIRVRLYRLVAIPGLKFFDLGDTITDGTLEEVHARQQAIVKQLIADKKRVVILGGGNDISYPDCAGLKRGVGEAIMAFNIDAHLDVRPDKIRNSGTPYRMLLEEGVIKGDSFFELGYEPSVTSPNHLAYAQGKSVQCKSISEWRNEGVVRGLRNCLEVQEAAAIFWGLDMDVVRSADAPGVSAPSVNGLSAAELLTAVEVMASEPRSRVLEVTEVNPDYDMDSRTCRLAATAVWYFLRGSHIY